MDSTGLYLGVVREFVAVAGGEPSAVQADTDLSYEHDGMVAHLLPHPDQESAVIDVEIMQITEPGSEPRNLERLLLLHQLNGVSRFGHGGLSFISLDNMLVYSRTVPLRGLTGQQLAEAIADALDQAGSLRSAWDQLRERVLAQVLQPSVGSGAAGAELPVPPFTIGRFA